MNEHHKTTSGRSKFWRSNPLPEQPNWTPRRPILAERQANKNPRRFSEPVLSLKQARNRKICELRAKGKSVKQLSKEFGLNISRIRCVLDENMTPEEILLDEMHTREALRLIEPGEAERAAELRRSGMKVKDVAKVLGRALGTTIKLLKGILSPEEITHRAFAGRGHNKGKYKPDALPKTVRRRELRENALKGARLNDFRPCRAVLSATLVPHPYGETRVYQLECGHVLTTPGSKALRQWKRCGECEPMK